MSFWPLHCLSLFRFTASDYLFAIVKLFICMYLSFICNILSYFIQNQFNRPKINIYTVEFGKIEQWKILKNCIFIQKAMLFTNIYQKKKKMHCYLCEIFKVALNTKTPTLRMWNNYQSIPLRMSMLLQYRLVLARRISAALLLSLDDKH